MADADWEHKANQRTNFFLSGQKQKVDSLAETHVSTRLTSLKKPPIGQKPVFIQPITSCTVPHGEVARFHACVSGTPKPEMSWFHNRQPVWPTKNVVFHFDEVTNSATLIIVDAFSEHAGQYTCRAANISGEAACSATLTITAEEEGNLWFLGCSQIPSDITRFSSCEINSCPEGTSQTSPRQHPVSF
ncbi:telokin [Hippoglossus hippoglossus]|uniref:telokin n=1 Tax=Hippoglossus hippoglossus TaxID=8267 RepID=UPI00148C61B1|nr:telokin [Hippoglossus hippoglossus]